MIRVNIRLSIVKKAFLLLILTLVSTTIFIGFHFLSTGTSDSLLKHRIREAFDKDNLVQITYPVNKYGFTSIRSLIGQDNFADCRMANSLISSQRWSMRDSVLPPVAIPENKNLNLCELLYNQSHGHIKLSKGIQKSRYWSGSQVVLGLGLRKANYYQITQAIKSCTYLAYVALAALSMWISPILFLAVIPIIVYGVMFSGIVFYGGVALSIPYLWALISVIILMVLIKCTRNKAVYAGFFMSSGMISAYFFLFDGSLMLSLSMYIIVCYFSLQEKALERDKYLSIGRYIFLFMAGFLASIIADQIASAAYLGFGNVWNTFSDALFYRLSGEHRNESIPIGELFGRLFSGYRKVAAFNSIELAGFLKAGMFAGAFGLALMFGLAVFGGYSVGLRYCLPICLAILLVLIRLVLFKNQSYIHSLFIGRYLFLTFAMGWSMFVLSCWVMRNWYYTNKCICK